ncbi:unnamed protein product [Fusarium venenatum]|uniref:Uncharacterized protein n=1 Tax=Fusarium venenatum TaxID=56646 RepID=A0A2L2SX39_9HYPO|nr:uncharacterized protein FVRRES_06840 [Fusarium venenatum]CEI62404.1 unnamed protein product [Fusarium venenatum]
MCTIPDVTDTCGFCDFTVEIARPKAFERLSVVIGFVTNAAEIPAKTFSHIGPIRRGDLFFVEVDLNNDRLRYFSSKD